MPPDVAMRANDLSARLRRVLVKVFDGAEKVLAATDLSWQVDVAIALALEVSGSTLRRRV